MAKINDNGSELFPILQPSTLTGLAKLAAEAEHVGDGHLIEFRAMEVRSVLNKSVSKRRLSLAYSINPYRGCEFGCRYCYARYTHEFLAAKNRPADTPDYRDPELFERLIFLKENAAWLLEQELRKIDPAEEIALGTATDPYQPIERTARITRSLLEVFARKSGYRLGIISKSQLILRDIDLLSEISKRNTLVLHTTITTPDAKLARVLEPRAPRPDLRFAAVKALREAGLTVGILCSPLLPGITDNEKALDAMARRAAEAGASFFSAQPLFLKSCSRPTFLSFVQEHFPHLSANYAKRFAGRDFASAEYRGELSHMVKQVCERYGLAPRSTDALLTRDVGNPKKPVQNVGAVVQERLFG
ncbi:SPL family radical SAM protein [Granulicella tundricola]|uniref:Radical SAM domain protein n=1 Tax=Granulicella tundricola (strain ATCC BAA-1859 / DSM 23138 / MP5ACTX9) TaxID=1198114 RepID=E8X1S1_GRATM|nr:radical SAM protein [Granulicella tundricola]ADW67990.1 Radical SAM domain protein [Granulicella tundricola MP5ACTX9]